MDIGFEEATTFTSFRRTRSIRSLKEASRWRLVRTWTGAGGDGALDEAICRVVASRVNEAFAILLAASVTRFVKKP